MRRFTQGQTAVLSVLCATATRVATQPDAPPACAVYSAAGTKLRTGRVWLLDRYRQPGIVAFRVVLDSSFPTGHYFARFDWKIAGVPNAALVSFEVTAGHADGAVLAMFGYERPQARFLVHQTENSTTRVFGRNPSV